MACGGFLRLPGGLGASLEVSPRTAPRPERPDGRLPKPLELRRLLLEGQRRRTGPTEVGSASLAACGGRMRLMMMRPEPQCMCWHAS